LLLDEPTSQLDPDGAEGLLELAAELGSAVVLSEQRPERALAVATRVLSLDAGPVLLDAAVEKPRTWPVAPRPAWDAPVDRAAGRMRAPCGAGGLPPPGSRPLCRPQPRHRRGCARSRK